MEFVTVSPLAEERDRDFSAGGSSGNWMGLSEQSRYLSILWIFEYHSYKSRKFLWSYQTNQKPTVTLKYSFFFFFFFPILGKSHLWQEIWTKRQLMSSPLIIFFFHYSLEALSLVRMFFISILLRGTFDFSNTCNTMNEAFC